MRRGAGPTLAAALRQAIADQERTLLDAGLGFSKVDRAFRRAIVAANGNAILLRQYDAPRDRQHRISVTTVGHDPARIGRFIAEHREIAATLERRRRGRRPYRLPPTGVRGNSLGDYALDRSPRVALVRL